MISYEDIKKLMAENWTKQEIIALLGGSAPQGQATTPAGQSGSVLPPPPGQAPQAAPAAPVQRSVARQVSPNQWEVPADATSCPVCGDPAKGFRGVASHGRQVHPNVTFVKVDAPAKTAFPAGTPGGAPVSRNLPPPGQAAPPGPVTKGSQERQMTFYPIEQVNLSGGEWRFSKSGKERVFIAPTRDGRGFVAVTNDGQRAVGTKAGLPHQSPEFAVRGAWSANGILAKSLGYSGGFGDRYQPGTLVTKA